MSSSFLCIFEKIAWFYTFFPKNRRNHDGTSCFDAKFVVNRVKILSLRLCAGKITDIFQIKKLNFSFYFVNSHVNIKKTPNYKVP